MSRREITADMRYALWRWQDIPADGQLYLRKLYLVRTPLFQVAIHWFSAPDPGRDLHDHPRDFVTLILRGSYLEEIPTTTPVTWWNGAPQTLTKYRSRGRLISHRAEDLHRISWIQPRTMTIVFWGRHRRQWGFQTQWGWRHWKTYLGLEQQL